MPPSPDAQTASHTVTPEQDARYRDVIGPWEEGGCPPLDDFEADTNFVVRAAAGSGKTTALVARMVALIRTGAAQAKELAAITFTRKAAGEMEGRFYEELRSAAQALADRLQSGDADPQTRAELDRVREAMQTVQQTFIGTVHAFCGRILREYAYDAGLPPDFAVGIEDRDFERLQRRVWHRYVSEARTEQPDLLGELQELGLPPEELQDLFTTVSHHPELDVYTESPDEPPDLSEAVAAARDFVREWQAWRPDEPIKDRKGAREALDRAEAFFDHRPIETPADAAELLTIVRAGYSDSSAKGRVTLSAWGKRGSDAYEKARHLRDEAYPDLVQRVIDPVLNPWNAYAHRKAVEFVAPAADRFTQYRREEGQLTHHDVLYWTRELLRDEPRVRRELQERSPRLLVDEFQDTDPLQAEILFYATATNRDETDWRRCTPAPGSLFIVGDDKQSIYRFRRADINVFNEVVRRIEDTGGAVVDLCRNFRSHGQILQFCDRAFPDLFGAEVDVDVPDHETVQARYAPFIAVRPPGDDPVSLRAIDCEYVRYYPSADLARDDAWQIARFIRAAVDAGTDHEMAGPPKSDAVFPGGAGYDDFLILTRTTSNLSIYAEALAGQSIPFTITGSKDLRDSGDVQDLLALLRAALRPDDPVASLAFLQSGLAGFSDDDLYRYRRAAEDADAFGTAIGKALKFGSGALSKRVRDALPGDLADRFEAAFGLVGEVRERLVSERPSTALPFVVEQTGLHAAAAAPPDARHRSLRAGRLLRAVELVQRRTAEGAGWAEVVDALHDVVHGEEDTDGLTLEIGTDDAVRVMNVHQAKGLEAPVVFLADPVGSGSNRAPTTHVYRGSDANSGSGANSKAGADGEAGADALVAPVIDEGTFHTAITHPPLGWTTGREPTFKEIEEAHEEAENTRLLYVAATRAERLLVVSRPLDKNGTPKQKAPWGDLVGYLGDDVPVLRPPSAEDAEGDASRTESAPAPDVDAAGRRRREAVAARARASFEQATVSSEKDDGAEADWGISDGGGYGRVFGTVVHHQLEAYVEALRAGETPEVPPVDRLFAALEDERTGRLSEETGLDEEGGADIPITREHADAARVAVRRFSQSDLAARLREAETVYTEYRFATSSGSAEDKDDEAAAPETVLRGVIDLVYRNDEGWHVVDYKTDRVADPASALAPGHPYCEQVRRYAGFWAELVGEPVDSASLWFTEAGESVGVSLGGV